MDLTDYRNSEREQARIKDLMRLIPPLGSSALDIGARDGFLSYLLANNEPRCCTLAAWRRCDSGAVTHIGDSTSRNQPEARGPLAGSGGKEVLVGSSDSRTTGKILMLMPSIVFPRGFS